MHEDFFERLAASEPPPGGPAPSRLKSRIYSALVRRQEQSGPLLSVVQTRSAGRDLCVFENSARLAPIGEKAHSFNFCSICHARVLAERVENAPIFWKHCPYVAFHLPVPAAQTDG